MAQGALSCSLLHVCLPHVQNEGTMMHWFGFLIDFQNLSQSHRLALHLPAMQNYFASSINLDRVEPANNAVAEFETNTHTIHAVASARLYHTQLNVKNCEWSYSRLKGTLSFGRDWSSKSAGQGGAQDSEKYWFSLVDKDTGRAVWMFKIPPGMDYQVDRPFFHVFQGRTRKYGFLFEDDEEAAVFSNKVASQFSRGGSECSSLPLPVYIVILPETPKRSRSLKSIGTKSKSLPVSISMISSPTPNSFQHVSHVGVNKKEGVFEASKDLDAPWRITLSDLQNYNVREVEHKDFSEGFWKGVENISRNNNDNLSTSAAPYMPDDLRRAAENVPICTVY